MSLETNFGLFLHGNSLNTKFAFKLTRGTVVFRGLAKANCGWYPDAYEKPQWAPTVPSTKSFFDQIVIFSMSKPSPRTFDNELKCITFFFDTKLNLLANSGRPNERKHVTAWCQIACTFDKKHILFKICFKKNALLDGTAVSKSTWYKNWGRASRRHGGFLIKKKRI